MGGHDGWTVRSPEQLGLNPDLIEAIGSRFQDWAGPNLHAVLIVRRGVLVYQRYFTNEDTRWGEGRVGRVTYDVSMRHELRSVTKSVISLVVGIAVGRGWIPNVDVPVVSFFSEYGDLGADDLARELNAIYNFDPRHRWLAAERAWLRLWPIIGISLLVIVVTWGRGLLAARRR